MNELKNLLLSVVIIQKKYDEIAKITGENFNIFSIMSMENSERYTHSAFIAELLNPKGSHYHGNIFLKLFLNEVLKIDSYDDIDLDNVTVIIEEYIGEINSNFTKGGYIDIVIKYNNGSVIVIENKINASDQKGQLLRYKNYYHDCNLIYLTKDRKEPSKESYYIDDENKIDLKDVLLISYENHIKNWLEKCHKEAIEQPMLREIIKQYLNLVKKITNQTTNNKMSDEIRNLINEENVDSIIQLNNEFKSIFNEVWQKIFNCINYQIDLNHESSIKVFITEDSSDGIYIGYQYFVNNINHSKSDEAQKIRSIIEKSIGKKIEFNNNFVTWYNPLRFNKKEKFESIGNKEILRMYKNPEYLDDFIKKIVDEENKVKTELEKLISFS